jgi:hypothetical protein
MFLFDQASLLGKATITWCCWHITHLMCATTKIKKIGPNCDSTHFDQTSLLGKATIPWCCWHTTKTKIGTNCVWPLFDQTSLLGKAVAMVTRRKGLCVCGFPADSPCHTYVHRCQICKAEFTAVSTIRARTHTYIAHIRMHELKLKKGDMLWHTYVHACQRTNFNPVIHNGEHHTRRAHTHT